MRVYFSLWLSGVLIDQAGGVVFSEDLQLDYYAIVSPVVIVSRTRVDGVCDMRRMS